MEDSNLSKLSQEMETLRNSVNAMSGIAELLAGQSDNNTIPTENLYFTIQNIVDAQQNSINSVFKLI